MVDQSGGPRVIVLGAGPAGLASAGALAMKGVQAIVLDRAPDVGSSWRGHYDRLRLHTTRGLSALPGLEIPAAFGRWVARDDFVHYLEGYQAHFRLDVRLGVEVVEVQRGSASDDARWVLRDRSGLGWPADHVIVATGYNHTAAMPTWPGQDGFTGDLHHASSYRNPSPYAGRSVLVAGTGNTGCEIAQDLSESGCAPVWLAYRTPPHILRRDTGGWPSQWTGVGVRRLPAALVDRVAGLVERASIPDLTAYGLPRPPADLASRVREGSIPVQDVGIVAAIRSGAVRPVPMIDHFSGPAVILTDGAVLQPDSVIVAAGYRRGLDYVSALDVLRADGRPVVHGARNPPGSPGLWFNGYTNPISGMLREISRDASAIASAIVDSDRRR